MKYYVFVRYWLNGNITVMLVDKILSVQYSF